MSRTVYMLLFTLSLFSFTNCESDDDQDQVQFVPEGFGGEVAITFDDDVYSGIPGFAALLDTTISIGLDTTVFNAGIFDSLPYRQVGDSVFVDFAYNNWLALFASDVDTEQQNIEGTNFSFIILGYQGPGLYDQFLTSESFILPLIQDTEDEGIWTISFSNYESNNSSTNTAASYLGSSNGQEAEIIVTSDGDNRLRGTFSFTSGELDDSGNLLRATGDFDVPFRR